MYIRRANAFFKIIVSLIYTYHKTSLVFQYIFYVLIWYSLFLLYRFILFKIKLNKNTFVLFFLEWNTFVLKITK